MSEWKRVKLRDCVEEVNERTTENNQYEVLTSSKSGIYSQEDYFDKQVASKDNTGYKIIKRGQFTYRSMSDNGTFTINRLENRNIGIVSPAYPVFEAISINPEYLKYFFQSEGFRKEIYNLSQGSTRTALKYKDLSNIEILLPSITEQEKIVRILDNVDKIIKKIEKLKNNIKLSKKYIMNINFGKIINKGKRMKEVCTFFSGGTPSSQNKKYYEGDIPFIRSAEIDNCSTELKINDEGIKNSSAKIVKKGDLLLALYGANSGNVAISKIEGAINQAILCIRSNEIKIKYLKYLLEYDKNNILNKYLQGGQGNLSAEIIKNLKYDFQIKEEQEKIINILDLIENKINMIDILKEQYINVKKGLIQQLLTGKVRVKI